jgi:hypothetical protein
MFCFILNEYCHLALFPQHMVLFHYTPFLNKLAAKFKLFDHCLIGFMIKYMAVLVPGIYICFKHFLFCLHCLIKKKICEPSSVFRTAT